MTTSEIPTSALCGICGDPRDGHHRIHPFTPPGDRLPPGTFGRKRSSGDDGRSRLPFDPVLRQALLDKGIITPDDLRVAGEKVSAVIAEPTTSVGKGVGDGRPVGD